MNQDLFSEFKGSSDQEVRAQIQKDLKSLDFESTFVLGVFRRDYHPTFL